MQRVPSPFVRITPPRREIDLFTPPRFDYSPSETGAPATCVSQAAWQLPARPVEVCSCSRPGTWRPRHRKEGKPMRRLIAEVHTLKGKQTGKRRLSSVLLACALVTTLSPCGPAHAQGYRQPAADPVDALREVLRTPPESPGLRDAKLKTA